MEVEAILLRGAQVRGKSPGAEKRHFLNRKEDENWQWLQRGFESKEDVKKSILYNEHYALPDVIMLPQPFAGERRHSIH